MPAYLLGYASANVFVSGGVFIIKHVHFRRKKGEYFYCSSDEMYNGDAVQIAYLGGNKNFEDDGTKYREAGEPRYVLQVYEHPAYLPFPD